jgi:hypothetical protein
VFVASPEKWLLCTRAAPDGDSHIMVFTADRSPPAEYYSRWIGEWQLLARVMHAVLGHCDEHVQRSVVTIYASAQLSSCWASKTQIAFHGGKGTMYIAAPFQSHM